MKTVSVREYEKIKIEFLHKHKDWEVETSPMDEYGRYHKTYVCEDGAVLTEVNEPTYEIAKAEVDVRGVKFQIEKEVKLFRSECWNTDNAESIVCYEKF